MKEKKSSDTAESFLGSVFKFSISTYINFFIYGVSILITGFMVPAEVNGPLTMFITTTNTIMTIAILGLDQSFIRFFNEPPGKLSTAALFRNCFGISALCMVVFGTICGLLFPDEIASFLGFTENGNIIVPLLFLNAFFLMIARYFNVLYRMEQNIKLFTIESILMQFFYKLFYLFAGFFGGELLSFVIVSVLGMFAFATIFSLMRRSALIPQKGDIDTKALKTILPYGLALAPTAVLVYLNGNFSTWFIGKTLTPADQGYFGFAVTLANVVTIIQAGFSTFWGAYMFANYKTQQPRIKKVTDFLNFIILVFFCFLVAFENIVFWIIKPYAACLPIFPLMMLAAVFPILCEGTVYGIAIAKKPVFDTIGIGLSFVINMIFCFILAPKYGLIGAAMALVISAFFMFTFRTVIAQKYYRTIRYPAKTALAILIAFALTAAGTLLYDQFVVKLLISFSAMILYCFLYKDELFRCIKLTSSILNMIFKKNKKGV